MTIEKLKNVGISVLAVVVITLLSGLYFNSRKITEQANLITALNDTVTIWKDRDGVNNSKIQTLQTGRTKDFLAIKSKDKSITDLQKVVKEYEKNIKNGGSVTNFTSVTTISSKGQTKVTPGTTVRKDSLIYLYPTYSYEYQMLGKRGDNPNYPWIKGSVVSNKDTTVITGEVINDYSAIIGEESQGWFKKPKPFVLIKNYNPYSTTTEVRTYEVKIPKPKLRVRPGVYAGFGGTLNQGQVYFGPQVGVGLNLNLW